MTYSYERLDRVAAAIIVRGSEVLMAHRHPERRWYPDCWDLIGGHIQEGETPEEAVGRECQEEVGVLVQQVRPVPMVCSDPAIEMHAFVVSSWRGEPANLAPDEHDHLTWFQPDELSGLVLADPASLPDILKAVEGLNR